jgi:hypothetical protein
MSGVTIIVPAYNEGAAFGAALTTLQPTTSQCIAEAGASFII